MLRSITESDASPLPSPVVPAPVPPDLPGESGAKLGEAFSEVLAAARVGAEWAWTALYRSLAPAVLSYLRAQGPSDAEDLTGEVFLQVARDLPTFYGNEQEFRSWVLAVSHHRLLDHRRYERRRPVQPAPPEALTEGAKTGNVEEEALRNLASERVHRLIRTLTPDQRDTLLLRILGGFTVEEVADMIGKRPNAVKALQRRGLGAIRRALSNGDAPAGAVLDS